MKDIHSISGDVIDIALRIHRELGPGLLESVYETVLAGKLSEMGYSGRAEQCAFKAAANLSAPNPTASRAADQLCWSDVERRASTRG